MEAALRALADEIGGRCSRPWSAGRPQRASWRRCCRLLARACRGICGCCARRGLSWFAGTGSGGSTAFAPNRSPRSMNGWAGTEPCGSSGSMPCTPRWPGENANEGAPDDEQRTCEQPHPGQPAMSRWQGHRAHGRPLRHRHRRLVGSPWIPSVWPAGSAMSRATCDPAASTARTSLPAERKAWGAWKCASPHKGCCCGPSTSTSRSTS